MVTSDMNQSLVTCYKLKPTGDRPGTNAQTVEAPPIVTNDGSSSRISSFSTSPPLPPSGPGWGKKALEGTTK